MTSAVQIPDVLQGLAPLGVPGVQEPTVVQYEDYVWSCREKREIRARLYYSLTREDGRNTYRLLFIEPLL